MSEQKWFSLEITVDIKAVEAIEFALNELDSPGTEINNLGKLQTETVCVIGYFNEKPTAEILHKQTNEALQIYGCSNDVIKKIEWREVENKDWLAEWKKHWKPTETRKFIIAPSWEKIENSDKIIIRIEPGMAFGTGTHETTKLCLQSIEENFQDEMSFLDVGTGTGILAIAASKLQTIETSSQIVGCDVDDDSINISVENAELNDAVQKTEFFKGSISVSTPAFDFICANVTADVIIPMLPLLIEKSKKILVLSGILAEQEILVVSELKKLHITDFIIERLGEWISVTVSNHKAKQEF